jgi:hypothetical protein
LIGCKVILAAVNGVCVPTSIGATLQQGLVVLVFAPIVLDFTGTYSRQVIGVEFFFFFFFFFGVCMTLLE